MRPVRFLAAGAMVACLVNVLASSGTLSGRAAPARPAEALFFGTSQTDEETPAAKVEVQPEAPDDEIRQRLADILQATGWFAGVEVQVREGVVFLEGRTEQESSKQWAGELARNTEGVVAVVNSLETITPTIWDFTPAWQELRSLARGMVRALPLLVLGLVVFLLTWAGGKLTSHFLRRLLRARLRSHLLREVAARSVSILIFVLGLYLVLRVAGLTRLAVTVIGGTGLIGLVLGIAFRDITENFLASLFLSLQHPFREGDLVQIEGVTGFVQRLTSRTTVLMTLDGNQVQIPNATVYKSSICNYTSNPNRRVDFLVGIGYDDGIPQAQQVALRVLAEHPAVLKELEPWVLVDSLGSATVMLRVYFWLDGSRHSWLKVKSSVIRLIKRAFQDAGISLPDEAREVLFPEGVPVRMLDDAATPAAKRYQRAAAAPAISEAVSTQAEGGLRSEAGELEEQARQSWSPDYGENLLADATPKTRPSGE